MAENLDLVWALPLVTNHDVEVRVRLCVCASVLYVCRGWLPASHSPTHTLTFLPSTRLLPLMRRLRADNSRNTRFMCGCNVSRGMQEVTWVCVLPG
jgi:hypothetical protein